MVDSVCRRHLPRRVPRGMPGCGIALGLLCLTEPGWGDSCRPTFSGAASREWVAVVRALDASAVEDCASIRVEVQRERARLIFTTRDGRRAERLLGSPSELSATVAALGANDETVVDASRARRQPTSVTNAAPSSPALPERTAPAPASIEPSPPDSPRVVLAALAGVRGGGARLLSPALAGAAAIDLGAWQLGVLGEIDTGYTELGSGDAGVPRSSVLAAGITVARRLPIADDALLIGTRFLYQQVADKVSDARSDESHGAARLGIYTSLSWPRRSETRLRIDLGFDRGGMASRNGAITPPWAARALLGVEVGAP